VKRSLFHAWRDRTSLITALCVALAAAVARPLGYRVYFKAGWLDAWTLANEAARLERRRIRIGIAVFTDRNAPGDYGKETIAGVTARLLRR
jgi:hypothetical protein